MSDKPAIPEKPEAPDTGMLCIKMPPIQCECTPAPADPEAGETATLKDQLAMAALTGLLSGNDILLQPEKIDDIVNASYNIADRMLVERDDASHSELG